MDRALKTNSIVKGDLHAFLKGFLFFEGTNTKD